MKKRFNFLHSPATTYRGLLPTALIFAGLSSHANADILAQWLPAAGDAATSNYNNATQTPPASVTGAGVTASNAARVNQPGDANAGAVWPGSVANRGGAEATYNPETSGYTQFTITPLPGSQVTYANVSYSLNSYGGMNDAGGYTGVIRTSVDNFASELTTQTIANAGVGTFILDLSTLGTVSTAITFRIYIVGNTGADTWADLTTANGGMVVNGVATARHENITWTAGTSDIWDIGGTDDNWSSSDKSFQQGDNVTFNDTVNSLFSGQVGIIGTPLVGTFTANNSTVNYTLAGKFAGSGALTKNGTGLLSLLVAEGSIPFSGPITINAGTLELAGNTTALSNVPLVTVNPGGTFRFAANNAGQDSSVPFMLAGGTLDVDDGVFTWPDNKTVTLAANTTSTIDTSGPFIIYNNRLTGSGNLIKTGASTLEATATYNNIFDLLTYTGSTEIQEGVILIGSANTAASTVWKINGGTLRLNSDTAAPIANLPSTAALTLSAGGTFDVRGNTEAIGSLKAAGGTLFIDATTKLAVTGTLDLTGGELNVTTEGFTGTGPIKIMDVGAITGPLTNLRTTGRGGVFSVQNGILTMTATPASFAWTAAISDTWEINGADANWSSPDGTFQQGDSVTFDDTVDAVFSGQIGISGVPVIGTLTASNSAVDYTLAGSFDGRGALTKSGTGRFTVLAPDGPLPFAGPITINAGVFELAGNTNAFSNVPMVTVNPGATFRYAADNSGQDSNVPFTLTGGTLQVNDTVFTWPENKSITLAGSTTSIVETGTNFYIYNNVIKGSGNLVKTGAGTLDAASNYGGFVNLLTYTGSTEVREGLFRIGASNTAVSNVWAITGGEFRLDSDSVAPIANLPPSAAVSMSAGTFNASGNTETIASLTVTGGTLLLNAESMLTVSGTLDLTGGELNVVIDGFTGPGPITVMNVAAITGPLGNLKTTAPGGTFRFAGGVLTLTADGIGTSIEIDSLVTAPGTTAGTTKVTLEFTASVAVDIYASSDLTNWGAPIATGVTTSTFIEDNLPAAKRFYVVVIAGSEYPPVP